MPECHRHFKVFATAQAEPPPATASSPEILQALLESAEEGIIAIIEREQLCLYNDNFSRMWRIPDQLGDADPSHHLFPLLAGQLTDPASFLQQLDTLRSQEQTFSTILLGKDGRLISYFSSPLFSQGEVIGRLHRFGDNSGNQRIALALQQGQANLEKMVAERTAELQNSHHKLQQTEKMAAIGRLSASIAHELNNPLFGVINVLRGVQKRATLQPEDAKLVEMAIHECLRMKDLIQNLQHFNRPTSGMMISTDLHRALDEMLLFSKKELENKNIVVVQEYAADLPRLKAVEDQLKQVVLNLLNNAADACPRGGRIRLATSHAAEHLSLTIQDTGIGIQAKDLPHIFEPFFTTKPAVKGTGLGLAVTYGIVKRHGGTIEVASTPGQGTTFTITLPIGGDPDA